LTRYGLKGKVDVSVTIAEGSLLNRFDVGERKLNRVPLELKTGKLFRKQGTIEHRAQVSVLTGTHRFDFSYIIILYIYIYVYNNYIRKIIIYTIFYFDGFIATSS